MAGGGGGVLKPVNNSNSVQTVQNLYVSGNIGVGTSGPATSLHIQQASDEAIIRLQPVNSGARSYDLISTAGSSPFGQGNFSIYDRTSNISRLFITNNGSVGLGLSPYSSFHVGYGNDTITVGSPQFVGNAANTTTYGLTRSTNTLQFTTYRDVLAFKIGAKICGINRQTYFNESNREWIQSTDLAFYTVPPSNEQVDGTQERMRITDTGNIGFSTSNPSSKIHIVDFNPAITIESTAPPYTSGAASILFRLSQGDYFLGQIVAVDEQTIPSATYLGGLRLKTSYDAGLFDRISIAHNGAVRFNAYGAGTLTTDSNGNISNTSDKRIKKNIKYLENSSLEIINYLKPCSFQLLSDPDKTRLGFIAQDVEQFIPDAVDGKKYEYQYKIKEDGTPELDENGNLIFEKNAPIRPRSLDSTAILAHSVKAIQELTNKNKMLENRVIELEEIIKQIQAKLM